MNYWKCAFAAAGANCIVLALSLARYGTLVGGGAAARNTARFAALIFLAAFAAPGLRRWLRFPEPAFLIMAYVAAQLVHYAAVALLHTVFAPIRITLGVPQVAIVMFGFSLTMLMAFTAASRNKVAAALHKVTLYIVFLILAADYSSHPVKSMRLVAIPIFAALALRWIPRKSTLQPDAAGLGN